MFVRSKSCVAFALLVVVLNIAGVRSDPVREDAHLYRKVPVPEEFLFTRDGRTFGGDIRVGDLDGDARCDFLVYRCADGTTTGAHAGGMKPCFLGAFDVDGNALWRAGEGGRQPARPMSVAVHDFTGDDAAEVVCFWHRPDENGPAGWTSLADVVVQLRDGRTGQVLRQAAPQAITGRKMKGGGPNWVHQRLLIANFRGTELPRDLVVKLGDTYVALDDRLNVLWTYRTEWVEYSRCPAYIPSVGDVDGDGQDEVNGGYFVLDSNGRPLWRKRLARNMDSVRVAEWDGGHVRAICSGGGHVVDADGDVIMKLGEKLVPHGQEVRVADFRSGHDGPEMVIRWNGHTPAVRVVNSHTGSQVAELKLNPSPTNVGMTPVLWNGPDGRALLFNGGWLWDLESGTGARLPSLPPAHGAKAHRMAFYHCIAANVAGDARQEVITWDPTARHVYIYSPKPVSGSAYSGYKPGPRQYNPRLMD